MFNAIENITTEKLIAELRRRQIEGELNIMRYLVWNDHDPNDSFEVDASNVYNAAFAALDQLGWCLSGEPYDPAEDDEDA